jgi:hypothetical protein
MRRLKNLPRQLSSVQNSRAGWLKGGMAAGVFAPVVLPLFIQPNSRNWRLAINK